MKSQKELEVWKNSMDFVTKVYSITNDFPKSEIYGLTNQIRRSAVSIPSNIAEGAGRFSDKEFIQFLYISLGSLSELETQLIISKNVGYLSDELLVEFMNEIVNIRKMLSGLIKYLKSKTVMK